MNSSRARSFWWFQLTFWVVAGLALLISGLSQTGFIPALVRNIFLFTAGFLCSFFLATLIDRLRHVDELRLRLLTFPIAYVVALLCVVTINAISFTMQGVQYADISWGMWFSGTMNFALVYWFWSELFIQQVYLKGKPALNPGEQLEAGPQVLIVEDRGSKIRLNIDEIVAILAAGDYVEIDIGEKLYLDRRTIQSLEDRLAPAGFVRIHRSAIVNPSHVREIKAIANHRYSLRMDNDRALSSSRGYEKHVRQTLLDQ